MKNEVKIIEEKSNRSITGVWFKVYVNGISVGYRSTREEAEKLSQEILAKKTYRS
jgi:hypothetical protein